MISKIKSTKPRITFHIVTIFPRITDSYWQEGVTGRATKSGLISVQVHNLRDFSLDTKHHNVDDRPYGGGPGMVLEAQPIVRAVEEIKSKVKGMKCKVIITAVTGKIFDNKLAEKWSRNYKHLIIICGRYEGIDARVKKILKAEEVSIGPYILTGGELPAMVMIDAVARRVPGVLGDSESIEEKRGLDLAEGGAREVYTRPEVLTHHGRTYRAPKVLLSGDHAKITAWRKSGKPK